MRLLNHRIIYNLIYDYSFIHKIINSKFSYKIIDLLSELDNNEIYY